MPKKENNLIRKNSGAQVVLIESKNIETIKESIYQ